jgi:hypothetical protein
MSDMNANNKYAIWWLSQRSTEYLYKNHEQDSEELIVCLPTAVASEVRSRRGRAGRGRLWGAAVNHELGNIDWPEGHAVAKIIEDESCGGIVIEWGDVPAVISLPGFVTDAGLNLIHPA